MARASDAGDSSLKRLGGGRWQTRDERFTVEPQSGTWVVVDAEQTDDLGLPLVRGPFRSLGDAKDAIAAARSSPPAASPLADRVERRRVEPEKQGAEPSARRGAKTAARDGDARAISSSPPSPTLKAPKSPDRPPKETRRKPAEPAEPRWFAALEPEARRHARRLIARLEEAGAPDPDGMARRDIVGDVAAVAAFAVERGLQALGPGADAAAVAALLAEGRDDDLGVRWRLVDDDGRPIAIHPTKPGRSRG
ncbi:MAG TPA: hypothetical protein VIM39_06305 [Candidatus Limnocylindrales bacterium]